VSVTTLHSASKTSTATRPGRGPGAPVRVPDYSSQVDPRLTHLLRLSLDLQLDAMLFMLGAAATHDDAPSPEDGAEHVIDLDAPASAGESSDELPLPWRRWMTEDLELSRCLASTAATIGLALPPTLGRAGRHKDSHQVTDDLIARYEFMANLLGDLLERAAATTPRSLLEPVAESLERIRARLEELRASVALDTVSLGAAAPA